jgi:hypothetical protein
MDESVIKVAVERRKNLSWFYKTFPLRSQGNKRRGGVKQRGKNGVTYCRRGDATRVSQGAAACSTDRGSDARAGLQRETTYKMHSAARR